MYTLFLSVNRSNYSALDIVKYMCTCIDVITFVYIHVQQQQKNTICHSYTCQEDHCMNQRLTVLFFFFFFFFFFFLMKYKNVGNIAREKYIKEGAYFLYISIKILRK